MNLGSFITETLRQAGGVAEIEGEAVAALLPPAVAAALDLPEEARLQLAGPAAGDATFAGYGSELVSRLCALAGGGPRRFRMAVELPAPKRERVAREAEEALQFRNAVGRIEGLESATLHYRIYDFRYEAISEDRHEGLVSLALNGPRGWGPGLPEALAGLLAAQPEARRPWPARDEPGDGEPLYGPARALARALVRDLAGPFIARMQRRLGRDLRRIGDYYGTLREEVERAGIRGRGTPEAARRKAEAIDAEHRRRRRDLLRRYAVALRLEPLGIVALRVPGLILDARLRRRKEERRTRLAWNPISRRFDGWLCAGCGGDASLPFLCDRLHLLCAGCPPDCPRCGRPACPACGAGRCRCAPSGPGGAQG